MPFTNAITIRGPYAMDGTDFTARQDLVDLPDGANVFVKVWFEDLTNARGKSDEVTGHFHTLGKRDDIRFVWGGDTAGQGWGINKDFGGMKIYEAMRKVDPLFFIHSGDTIYADGVIKESVIAENGKVWTNLVTPEVSKVAETQAEFRGRYKYNLLDSNLRRFNAQVPQILQWDDHEIVNNWSDSKDLVNDSRYSVKDVPLLVACATKAFHEYAPRYVLTMPKNLNVFTGKFLTANCWMFLYWICVLTVAPILQTFRHNKVQKPHFWAKNRSIGLRMN